MICSEWDSENAGEQVALHGQAEYGLSSRGSFQQQYIHNTFAQIQIPRFITIAAI
jgi:hypothetical protein